jgi:hypothetical protein
MCCLPVALRLAVAITQGLREQDTIMVTRLHQLWRSAVVEAYLIPISFHGVMLN